MRPLPGATLSASNYSSFTWHFVPNICHLDLSHFANTHVSLKVLELHDPEMCGKPTFCSDLVFRNRTVQRFDIRSDCLWAPAQRKRATMLYFANVFFLFFLRPPYSPALVNGGSRKFYTWWTLSVIEEVTTWIFSWSSLNYRVGQKVTKFSVFSDPARKLSALTPERGRIL